MDSIREKLELMVADLKNAILDLPNEKAVEEWSEDFMFRLARICIPKRVI